MDCWWSICCAFFSPVSHLLFTIFIFLILCLYISDWTLPLFSLLYRLCLPCPFMWLSPCPSFISFLCLMFFYSVLWLFPFCLFLESCLFILFIMRLVSWCSWLSHHFHVVRVPGSNPGGTILTTLLLPWNASLLYVPCLYTFLLLYRFMSWVFCLECLYMSSHSVGSYQVGYTRSHPNTEVKMLRAC